MNRSNTRFFASASLSVLQDKWGWLLGLGLLFLVLGFIGLGMTFSLTVISVMYFGILLLIGGVVQFFEIFNTKQWRGACVQFFVSMIYIVAGGLLVYDPILGSEMITAILAWMFIIVGISRLLAAISLKGESGWFWILLSGLMTIALGVMILAKWPFSALWFIGLLVAIEMLMNGWTLVMLAFQAKRHKSKVTLMD